jgi:hypothetical protein
VLLGRIGSRTRSQTRPFTRVREITRTRSSVPSGERRVSRVMIRADALGATRAGAARSTNAK